MFKNKFSFLRSLKLLKYENQFSKKLYSSTIDKNEIKKFDKFSNEYNWIKSDTMLPLRNLNHLRIPLVKNHLISSNLFEGKKINLEEPLENFKLLDVGCGGGLLSEPLARLGANVTAIDANFNNINFAKNHLNNLNEKIKSRLVFENKSLDDLNNEKNLFDGIIASEVLEHVNDVEAFIKSSSSLLKNNGLFFITTINQTVFSYLFAILAAENILNLVPKNTHKYDKLVSLNGLIIILEENNFEIELVHGMCFNPITYQWSWVSETSMNYALVARKKNNLKISETSN